MNKKFSNTVSSIKKDLKKELRSKDYDKGKDTKTLLNILASFCYIGNALENFGKILISLVIIIMNTCLIKKNVRNIKFFSVFPMMSFFGLGTLTFLIILLHIFLNWGQYRLLFLPKSFVNWCIEASCGNSKIYL